MLLSGRAVFPAGPVVVTTRQQHTVKDDDSFLEPCQFSDLIYTPQTDTHNYKRQILPCVFVCYGYNIYYFKIFFHIPVELHWYYYSSN